MRRLTVYTLKNCDTCRQAVKWLRTRGHTFEERAIRETPPGEPELRAMLAAVGELRRLCNTTGRDYRALKLGDRLPAMSEDEAIKMLADNGSLVKRPFLIGPGVALVGFDEKTWTAALA